MHSHPKTCDVIGYLGEKEVTQLVNEQNAGIFAFQGAEQWSRYEELPAMQFSLETRSVGDCGPGFKFDTKALQRLIKFADRFFLVNTFIARD